MVKISLVYLLSLLVCFASGCKKESVSTVSSDSVAQVKLLFKNFECLDIISCEYKIEKRTKEAMVPSPSDMEVIYFGWLELSEVSAQGLKDKFQWKLVDSVGGIDDKLGVDLLSEEIYASSEFNQKFSYNSNYRSCRAYKVIGKSNIKIYFNVKRID